MRKEVVSRLLVGLLVIGLFLAIYNLNMTSTGFAVFHQNTCSSFDEGSYDNTACDGSLGLVVLNGNETTGSYTSKVLDASENVSWDNMTWQGSQELNFEARNCSSSDCSDSSFSSIDLENIGFTSRYFQYRVLFDSSSFNGTNNTLSLQGVSVESSSLVAPIQTSVSILEPSGTKDATTGISLNFISIGTGLACSYEVLDASDNAVVNANSTISGCNNLTFNLGAGEGDYIINVYATGSSGSASDSSTFSIDLSSSSTEEEVAESNTTSEVQVPVVPQAPIQETPKITELTISDVLTFTSVPGRSQEIKITAKNTGTEPLTTCSVKPQGVLSSWIEPSDESVNLNSGDSHDFSIEVFVPGASQDGPKTLTASVECAEKATTKDFVINVESKKLEFVVIDAQRTRSDMVRVVYSIQELTGSDKNVSIYFSLLDSSNKELANASVNRTLNANTTKEFTTNVPINKSLEGNFSLSTTINSEVYKTSVLTPISLGTPVGGLAVLGDLGLGSGTALILVIVVVVLIVVFIIARVARKRKSS